MLELNIDDRIYIGKIINSKRKFKGISQENWILDKGKPICSRKTLSAVENGSLTSRDEIYDRLAEKTGHRICYSDSLKDVIREEDLQELNSAAESFDIHKITRIIEKIKTQLSGFENFIVYHEFLIVLNGIHQSYSKPIPELDSWMICLMEVMKDYFPVLSELIEHILFWQAVRSNRSFILRDWMEIQFNFLKLDYVFSLYFNESYSESSDYLKSIHFHQQTVSNQMTWLTLRLILCSRNQQEEFTRSFNKLYSLINNSSVSQVKKRRDLSNLIGILYEWNYYEEIKKIVIENQSLLEDNRAEIQLILSELVDIEELNAAESNQSGNPIQKYWTMKKSKHFNKHELSDVIVNEITPYLKRESFFIPYFMKEMKHLCEDSRSYKTFFIFITKLYDL